MSPKKLSRLVSSASLMEELLTKHPLSVKSFRKGQIIEGTVVSVLHDQVLVDVGAKSEGIIRGTELADTDFSYKNLKEGDTILVSVVQSEDRYGYLVLSLKRAEKERKWRDFERMFQDGSYIEVQVLEYSKGGLLVDALGQRGFIPISHLDKSHFTDFSRAMAEGSPAEQKASLGGLKGAKIKVKVIEVDRNLNRLVMSEREALASAGSYNKKDLTDKQLTSFVVGDVLEGAVSGIVPFGLFVDIKKGDVSLDGLVHISEISWEKVYHPGNIYKVGDKVKVKVIEVNKQEKRVQLSIKTLIPNPWEELSSKYPVGSKVKGVVSKIVPFGAFVTIEVGDPKHPAKLDGLIHISETTGPLTEGEEITTMVTICDPQNQKLGLSVRQIEDVKMYK
ncbi:S1 RNA-binding domain-containing protein [Candidatus Parcubacteria bacterium]|nr:S1 RNA-binding domain-containing protein [Patescibacteria group bacterium]MBU4380941.1 S1 RNA-binding domain-containing protein [Patescibacteria group bacterium]MCG2689459.1 S1 RNA-binding domain-containing protein [Candidatus Parcubacteria bacterium]